MRPKNANMIGGVFGRLTVVAAARNRAGRTTWRCLCACGKTTVAVGKNLRSGRHKSCGCYQRDRAREINTTHGHAPGAQLSPTYRSWYGMLSRCRNAKSTAFVNYGGRGIVACERWEAFDAFLADMGERPPGTSLDRINNDGNYEPGNCRWATLTEQAQNRRGNRLTPELVNEIRGRAEHGEPVPSIARRLAIPIACVRDARNRKTWAELP